MPINFLLLMSKQGALRLATYFKSYSAREKRQITNYVRSEVLERGLKMSNVLDIGTHRLIYRRYASLYFVAGVEQSQSVNELIVLEEIHFFVEILDRYFGNVCELDLIFNAHKAQFILNEVWVGGYLTETSKVEVLKHVTTCDCLVEGSNKKEDCEDGLSRAQQMQLGRKPSVYIGGDYS